MESRRLTIPIYLNQRIVFDLLAIVQGGFTQLQTIKRSESGAASNTGEAAGEIGAKNVFAFLNLGFKGSFSKQDLSASQKEVEEERVYTPTSLFSKLRDNLIERKLLHSVDESFDTEKCKPGAFIEFSGILKKNPIVGYMEGIIQMMEMAFLFMPTQDKQQAKSTQTMLTQLKSFLAMLKQAGSLDLLSNLVSQPEIRAVIPVQLEYFSNESPADIIDGQFIIMGKVARYISAESSDSISLMRSTPLAFMPKENYEQAITGFKGMISTIAPMDEFITQVAGPSLLIIPIAIYA